MKILTSLSFIFLTFQTQFSMPKLTKLTCALTEPQIKLIDQCGFGSYLSWNAVTCPIGSWYVLIVCSKMKLMLLTSNIFLPQYIMHPSSKHSKFIFRLHFFQIFFFFSNGCGICYEFHAYMGWPADSSYSQRMFVL
jgi:hypothetical protein